MSYKGLFSKKNTHNDNDNNLKVTEKPAVVPSVKKTESKVIKEINATNKY